MKPIYLSIIYLRVSVYFYTSSVVINIEYTLTYHCYNTVLQHERRAVVLQYVDPSYIPRIDMLLTNI